MVLFRACAGAQEFRLCFQAVTRSLWSQGPERNLKFPSSALSTLSPMAFAGRSLVCGNVLLLKGPPFPAPESRLLESLPIPVNDPGSGEK